MSLFSIENFLRIVAGYESSHRLETNAESVVDIIQKYVDDGSVEFEFTQDDDVMNFKPTLITSDGIVFEPDDSGYFGEHCIPWDHTSGSLIEWTIRVRITSHEDGYMKMIEEIISKYY